MNATDFRAAALGRGVVRAALGATKAEMLALAKRKHLFPSAECPPPRRA